LREGGYKVNKKWRGRWWGGFKKELQDNSYISGLAGIGSGGIGLIASVPLSVGAVIFVIGGSIYIAAYRSYPEPLADPESLVGRTFSPFTSIPLLSDEIPYIGVFGETKSGKSTLLRMLQRDTRKSKSTRGLHATALRTNGAHPKVFFLLDGEGESPAEQSKICQKADLLFFVVDHNLSDSEVRISKDRKQEHVKFWKSMSTFFKDRDAEIKKIHVLLNKKDCWQVSAGASGFVSWGDELIDAINARVRCDNVTVDPHSNFETDDISLVWLKIEEFVT
jgi:hypothetical protein